MKAMVLTQIGDLRDNPQPLALVEIPVPKPQQNEILIKIATCGVCHTELDEIEGRTPPPSLPMTLGHQAVGRVIENGTGAGRFTIGQRVGVAWIFSACGQCDLCRRGDENLCDEFLATGRDRAGGYAEYMTIPEGFAYAIPEQFSDVTAAPLLCAGAIGYRSLMLSGLKDGEILGLTGFGASGHLVLKMVRHRFPRSPVFVFARSESEQAFARSLGAAWAGPTDAKAPEKNHAIIDTTPAWKPVVAALRNLRPGGRLVINAIRKETRDQACLLDMDYSEHLWLEKEIKSVANVARQDVVQFLTLAGEIPIVPETETFPLEAANQALVELKQRKIRGGKVLVMDS